MAELRAGFDHLPLGDVIRHLTGVDLQLYQDQLAHAGLDDPFWSPLDYSPLLTDWTVPTLLVDGWHDYPLPGCSRTTPPSARRPPRSGCVSAQAATWEEGARVG